MAIPLSYWATVQPGVLSAGDTVNTLYALMLTNNKAYPAGVVKAVTSADTISDLIGSDQSEVAQATVHFNGFTNSPRKPSVLYVARYDTAAAPAALYGANPGLTLAETQALTGSLTLTVDGTTKTINPSLTAATSFSNVASILTTDLADATVTYSSGSGAYTVTSKTTGETSAVSFASGTMAAALGLTAATGAVQSLAVNDFTAATQMEKLRKANGIWSHFWCAFDPASVYLDLAAWVSSTNDAYCGILHDTAVTAATIAAGTSLGNTITDNSYEGVAPVYLDPLTCAFIASIPCSVDWAATNGRWGVAFRYTSSLTAVVTDEDLATALEGAGYNSYMEVAGSGYTYDGVYPGCVSGQYSWLDSYFDQIFMNRNFQLNIIGAFRDKGQIPYSAQGDAEIEAALQPTITAMINFGAIRTGVTPSDSQVQTLTAAYGSGAVQNLITNGYFLYINCAGASATVRAKRQTPEAYFYYMDGQSVQRLTLNSIEVA